jgi:thioredoxin 1
MDQFVLIILKSWARVKRFGINNKKKFAMAMEIKDNNIDELINGDKIFMIDFWAGWCGPCKQLAPSIEEANDTFADRMTVAKANVDDNSELASKYGIRGIPTLLFFKGDRVIDRQVGAISKAKLWEKIEDVFTQNN